MSNSKFTFLVWALAFAGMIAQQFSFAQPSNEGNIGRKWLDVNYAGDTLTGHRLDIFLPAEGEGPYPVVVAIAGSAFFSDNSKGRAFGIGKPLLEYGFAVVATNHRSSRKSIFPAQINDIKGVVRFLRANASKYSLDTSFIGITGNSSGGHLSAMMGTSGGVGQYSAGDKTRSIEGAVGGNAGESSRVDAVVDWYGPTAFQKMDSCGSTMAHDAPDSPESVLVGGPIQENDDLCALAGPITYVDQNDPPFLIIHGDADPLVPHCQSVLLYEALKRAGVESEMITVPGGGHGGAWEEGYKEKMVSFFVKARDKKRAALKPKGLELPPLFSDHAVLQQNTKAAVWGKAAPNTEITISGSWGEAATALSDSEGNWQAAIQTPEAGGPYQVAISSQEEKIVIDDVLIGEVWLCSGQSNMEMPLHGFLPNEPVEGSKEAIQSAHYPEVRMFTVRRNYAAAPRQDLEGEWAVCSPETAGTFSATAFFFGRKLHEALGIPIGLIHSSWGGTPAEAWAPSDFLETMPDFKGIGDQMGPLQAEQERLDSWLKEKEVVEAGPSSDEQRFKGLDFGDAALATAGHNDEGWPEMNLPGFWEQAGMTEFDGVIWYRRKISIPDGWKAKEMVLELSPIDDMDRAFINGKLVGATEEPGFWQARRAYVFSGEILRPGENTIAVRVVDTGGGGGFHGDAADMRICPKGEESEAIALAGEWKYLPVAEYRWNKFFLLGTTAGEYSRRPEQSRPFGSNTPAALYNGMIAPLVPYAIKGAIWYQGESNVGRAEQYKALFPTMIRAWRGKWRREFPFYFVQIAPYPYSGEENTESAELRFAQNQTLSLPKTGQAVTLDIGSMATIHPPNKKDVGERLALWARAKDYEQKGLSYSGPVCRSARREGEAVILDFDPGAERLAAGPGGLKEFEFVFEDGAVAEAEANIQGNKVVLPLKPGKAPRAVRYAWKNGSAASLFNSAGLPASTFYFPVE